MKILIDTSARHIHICKTDFEILFGKGYELTNRKDLSQPGQFACVERLTIVGPKGELKNVTILGPLRSKTQVEISLTDARKIGINAPIRDSGNLTNTPGCKLIGPNGSIDLKNGVIIAKRHIHLDPVTANKFNVKDSQKVSVTVYSNDRSLTFDEVYIRVNDNFSPAMHIDTDEANAAVISANTYGEIIL